MHVLLLWILALALPVAKEEIARLEEGVKNEGGGALKAQLAAAYLRDQDQERAFSTFLEALEATEPAGAASVSQEEQRLYDEALALYMGEGRSGEIAERLKERFSAEVEGHEERRLLAYPVAIAHANLGDYESFFSLFYRAYPHFPDHYLAYKAKTVLHIKLFERKGNGEEKERERAGIVANAAEAVKREPADTALYKWILTFCMPEERPRLTALYLQKIVGENILVPRSDIGFYVQKAAETDQLPLAERFVEKAREWYRYSRVVNAAQQYLDQKKRQ